MEQILSMSQEAEIASLLISALLILAGPTVLCLLAWEWVQKHVVLARLEHKREGEPIDPTMQ